MNSITSAHMHLGNGTLVDIESTWIGGRQTVLIKSSIDSEPKRREIMLAMTEAEGRTFIANLLAVMVPIPGLPDEHARVHRIILEEAP